MAAIYPMSIHFVIDMVLKGFVSGPAQLAYNSLFRKAHMIPKLTGAEKGVVEWGIWMDLDDGYNG